MANYRDLFKKLCYICYTSTGGDHLSGLKLDKQNRELSLTKKVDRETTNALNIVIKATENCNLNIDFFSSVYNSSNVSKSSFPANAPSAYNSSDESLLWVRVDVVDINDNPPQFSSHDLSAGAVFDVEIGTEVLNLAVGYKFDILKSSNSLEFFCFKLF